MSHSCLYKESFLCALWLTFMCVSWLISMCTMTHIYEYHKSWTISVVLEIWLFLVSVFSFMCAMSHSCVCHVSFLREPWLSPTSAMTHSYVWRESFVRVPWPTFMCTMTHEPSVSFKKHDVLEKKKWAFVCRDSYLCVCPIIPWLTFMYTMTHIFENDVFFYVCHDSHLSVECVMDQSFKQVISQHQNMSIWKKKRNSSFAHVLTHTHTHIHIRIYMYIHSAYCKSNQNRTE